jgi:hypothetical protein
VERFRSILRLTPTVFFATFCNFAHAQTLELSLEDGRAAARQAALTGQSDLARDFALALTDADPDDRAALVVLAAVQPQLGAPRDGRLAGARAYRLSQTDEARYEAARLTALAAANEDRYTLSQLWLRRASVNAPDEEAFEQTQSDYRAIRNLNPWSINIGLSFAPSNNVNGGSETEFNVIDGLPFVGVLSGDAQALAGVSATADLRLAHAISRQPDSRTSLTARAYARAVWLSDDAEIIAPTSTNSDFGSQVLEFGLNHQRRLGDGTLSAEALTGLSWFGGDIGANYNRASLRYGNTLSESVSGTISGEVQQTNLEGLFARSNIRSTLTTQIRYKTDSGNRLSGMVSFGAQSSENLNERYETITAQVSYAWTDPIGPIQLSLTAGVSQSHYRDYTILLPVPDGRTDMRVFGSATAVFQDINYAGFVPVVTLGVQDTQSNVSRFERNEYSVNIGFRSSF